MTEATSQITTRTGGCYCGALRYKTTGRSLLKGQCHCSACQHIAGGGPHYFELIDADGFAWTSGTPATFSHPEVSEAVTRFFCAACGTHIVTRRTDQSELVLKIGSLDDASQFFPRVAICHAQALPFHHVPEGVAVFDGMPRRG